VIRLYYSFFILMRAQDVNINKYFDDPMLLELARQEAEMASLY